MTPDRYRECVAALGYSLRGLAGVLTCSDRLTREWATGASPVPTSIAVWLEACAALRRSPSRPEPPRDDRGRRRKAAAPRLPPPPRNWRSKPVIWITHRGYQMSLSLACREADISRPLVYHRAKLWNGDFQAAFDDLVAEKRRRRKLESA
jgi:hypothetical protein